MKTIIFFTLCAFDLNAFCQFTQIDKERILQAERIDLLYGNTLWAGINKIPFTILYLTNDGEYLINHPKPSPDFTLLKYDSALNTNIFYRKSKLNKGFLATFAAVSGVNCIVIGTPENTGKSPSEWIITLLHEHFHLYEYNSNDYTSKVESLNLSGGDKSGMWMLNYPFPYDSPSVQRSYLNYTNALFNAVEKRESKNFRKYFRDYKRKRILFRKSISPSDYKYFSFQLWQEGIARYTEYKYFQAITHDDIHPVTNKTDFQTLERKMFTNETTNLKTLKLQNGKRICFYSVGFAEGLLLDHKNEGWRNNFLNRKFYLEDMLN